MGIVYLWHFETKYKHCQHYLGYSKDDKTLQRRERDHLSDCAHPLTNEARKVGKIFLVRVWKGKDITKDTERQLRRKKNNPRLCPICNPHQAQHLLDTEKRQCGK